MAKPPIRLPKIDRWAEAADRAHVPVEDFRLWALRHLRGVNPKQWSHWDTGVKPVPERIIIQFLLWRLEETKEPPGPAGAVQKKQ